MWVYWLDRFNVWFFTGAFAGLNRILAIGMLLVLLFVAYWARIAVYWVWDQYKQIRAFDKERYDSGHRGYGK